MYTLNAVKVDIKVHVSVGEELNDDSVDAFGEEYVGLHFRHSWIGPHEDQDTAEKRENTHEKSRQKIK